MYQLSITQKRNRIRCSDYDFSESRWNS